ncbi:MAG TPA: hypothetical protein VJ302_19560 [Blastocatellia bacterium]|nr:hypothetical protein [Blastocatellia bacterium]
MYRSITLKTCLAVLALSLVVFAQQAKQEPPSKPKPVKKAGTGKKKAATKPAATPTSPGAVNMPPHTVEAKPYLPGMVNVTVKGQDNPVVGIGMALSGVTVIEFPHEDSFFAVHPPENGDFIRIEKSPSMKSDHHVVLRAGVDLFKETGPAASMTIQMTSGLTAVLWIYPTKTIEKQTHRCVFRYNRNDIVVARQQAGLAVNLDRETEGAGAGESKSVTAFLESLPRAIPASAPAPLTASSPGSARQDQAAPPAPDPVRRPDPALNAAVKNALNSAMKQLRLFRKWSSATNGLSVSTRAYDLNDTTRIVLIAVKNTEDSLLRLMPGHPELVIETRNEKDKVVQLTQVDKLAEETSAKNQVIGARGTVYYAIAYTAPVLSTKQFLRVTVGQKNAADAPAVSDLSARRKA